MTDAVNVPGFIRLLRGLRAVRELRPDPISEAALRDILEVARWTGSGRNIQPWELVVVRDRSTLQALANDVEGHAKHLASAAVGIVVIMANDPQTGYMEEYDEGRLSERIMLAAAAHGVDSCIGWFVGAGRDQVKQMLGIPAERTVRTVLSLGYPDEAARRGRTPRPQPRKPLAETVSYERYRAR